MTKQLATGAFWENELKTHVLNRTVFAGKRKAKLVLLFTIISATQTLLY